MSEHDLLEVRDFRVSYGAIEAVRGVDIRVPPGSIIALIGPNGAGKTSLIRGIGGQERSHGTVLFRGQDVSGWPAHRISRAGFAQVPQGRRLFPDLTVAENLALGAYRKSTTDDVRDTVYRLFPVLGEPSRARQRVGSLSGGEQQMVALARALLAAPALIAMDEPSFGLAPILVGEVFDLIKQIAEMGIAILLVEQNATKALEVADYAYVLDQGSVVFEGTASDVSANVDLMSAYTA